MKFKKLSESFASSMESLTPRQLLALAGIAGFLTFLLLFIALSDSEPPEEKPAVVETPMVKVVEAKMDIPARAQLRESMLHLVEVPKALAPEDALTDIAPLVGRPARITILAGDILTNKKLYTSIKESGFTGIIPDDCRALSIGINDITGVAGFAKPGDYVDVMLVSEKLETGKITGEILLQNVMLLSINKMTDQRQNPQPKPEEKKDDKDKKDNNQQQNPDSAIDKPATATLAVHPEEVLRIAVAAKAGEVYLVLRPYKPSTRYTLDTEYYLTKDKGKVPSAAPAPAPAPVMQQAPANQAPPEPKTASSNIQVIRGTTATKGQ